ncbi:hypothetical protein BDP55DRAFT_647798 [Colletotrichum godetiae]|uniref:Uncharacterized protein n=1 Tax=Colletotrichum godetiae TaxID=1209918 RepID=A0AAJ0AUH5_9PEZI|nr:uncharacterized protein BDP55DRAFT_647798 [Colletotrichum godetiae]KAK1690603.1 hypothetical protein BDP55DRAFT_647798 [Colletotrichum godetiae]
MRLCSGLGKRTWKLSSSRLVAPNKFSEYLILRCKVRPPCIFGSHNHLLHAIINQGLQVPKHGDHVGDSNWRQGASNDISRAYTTQFWFHLMCAPNGPVALLQLRCLPHMNV